MTKSRSFLLLFILLGLLLGCENLPHPCSHTGKQKSLFMGLKSYQTGTDVAKIIEADFSATNDYCEGKSAATQYHVDKKTVMNGYHGTLKMVFFGDRLVSTIFIPNDKAGFFSDLYKPTQTEAGVAYLIAKDRGVPHHISMYDIGLYEKMNAWSHRME